MLSGPGQATCECWGDIGLKEVHKEEEDAAMRKTDSSRWKRQVEKLRLEDKIQGRLQKEELAKGGRVVLWLFMTDINKIKDVSADS